ncbi:hypothetical protein HG536_0H02090 [Torulaspora globosa]|uniref:F-box domain-containing protein n=1 Tax=Torulaspora globosa TaxID=48254 RepID=A0A7G3ZMU8_9SACH|nr:uncharacterized protein HG536_0H02090 [Torulaspora globosa]QLL34834.1 hypothetical protein HG536_0H02090 [Torulaspora globosa]
MRDASSERTPLSLTELPLNVLFQILCFLEREELRNVARCCRMLRILANENLMLSNSLVELHGCRNQWTRRLLFDVFDILNGSRNLLMKLTLEHNVSVFESVRYVQQRCELECQASGTQMLLLRNEEENFVEHVRNANENNRKNDGKMTYLKILQGFNNLALAARDSNKSETIQEEVETPTRSGDPVSYEPALDETKTVSPAVSNYSKSSAASIFSDLPPKLSNRGWHSSIYELEHVSDHTDASTSDSDTSSSADSIVRLRNSTKVRDKAALFEKLFSEDYEVSKSPKKCRKKKSYGALAATTRPDLAGSRPASGKRSISQGYLEELARCNLASQPSSLPGSNEEQTSQNPILKYQDHVLNEYDVDINTLEDQTDKRRTRPRARIFRRSKLTAFVTDDNKICYEKS